MFNISEPTSSPFGVMTLDWEFLLQSQLEITQTFTAIPPETCMTSTTSYSGSWMLEGGILTTTIETCTDEPVSTGVRCASCQTIPNLSLQPYFTSDCQYLSFPGYGSLTVQPNLGLRPGAIVGLIVIVLLVLILIVVLVIYLAKRSSRSSYQSM